MKPSTVRLGRDRTPATRLQTDRPAGKIVRLDPDYAARARESGRPLPTTSAFSVSYGGHVAVGADDDIRLPGEGQDRRVELGLVTGRRAREVTAETALSHVAGHTVTDNTTAWSRPDGIPAHGGSASGH